MGSPETPSQERRTLRRAVTLEGVGMHTGVQARVTFGPGDPGSGIVFRRTDLPGAPAIPAQLSSVSGVERSTTLAANTAPVNQTPVNTNPPEYQVPPVEPLPDSKMQLLMVSKVASF